MVTAVLDSQAGSCGKGKLIGYLANEDNIDVAVDNFMSNAGHTYVDDVLGIKVMTQQLPTSIVNPATSLVIGPEAAITPSILFEEILKYHESGILGDRKVIINPNAVVIIEKHRKMEQEILRSGSTFKGCGAARADKVMRQAMLFGTYWEKMISDNFDSKEEENELYVDADKFDTIRQHIIVMDTMRYLNDAVDNGYNILIEGSQGCDLDINYGLPYPNTTSRQCHAGQLVADCGISPRLIDEIYMIMRPYPIRISNTTNLKDENGGALTVSSGEYNGAEEITWDIIKKRCGAPDDVEFGEMTTVTKKKRRVFEMNWDRLKYVTKLNRPTGIMLNFAQYIDWGAYKCRDYAKLPQAVLEFIDRVESETGVQVLFVGTGPSNEDIIDLRSVSL